MRELVPLMIPLLTAKDVRLNCASVAFVKFLGEFKFWATETRLFVSDLLFVVKFAVLWRILGNGVKSSRLLSPA